MKPGLPIKLFTPLLALTFAGCVSTPSLPDTSVSHPANPQALESLQAPASPMLMAGSQGPVVPLSTNQTEMKHEEHQQKPANKDAQQPAEHKHEKEEKK